MKEYLIVVQSRAEYQPIYIGGVNNWKNWRKFTVATAGPTTAQDAWKEFELSGGFNAHEGRKLSASLYTRAGFNDLLYQERITGKSKEVLKEIIDNAVKQVVALYEEEK